MQFWRAFSNLRPPCGHGPNVPRTAGSDVESEACAAAAKLARCDDCYEPQATRTGSDYAYAQPDVILRIVFVIILHILSNINGGHQQY
eukprot:scaffold34012_cov46-Prasinocladus_malaysianus.AAC.2